MTLILKLDIDMVKMYHHTKTVVSMSTGSKVIAQTDTHTHRHNENITSTTYMGGKDVYLWDRDINNLEPLALQVSTTPLSADAAKMLTQTATNVH